MQCVQQFDGSRISCGLAYHTTYRRLLRSSSNDVPRDPVLLVVIYSNDDSCVRGFDSATRGCAAGAMLSIHLTCCLGTLKGLDSQPASRNLRAHTGGDRLGQHDPSAGSPTETLLRLVLPLRDQV